MSQQDDERIARKLLDLGSRSDRVQIRNGVTYLDGYALGNGTVEIRSQVARERRRRALPQGEDGLFLLYTGPDGYYVVAGTGDPVLVAPYSDPYNEFGIFNAGFTATGANDWRFGAAGSNPSGLGNVLFYSPAGLIKTYGLPLGYSPGVTFGSGVLLGAIDLNDGIRQQYWYTETASGNGPNTFPDIPPRFALPDQTFADNAGSTYQNADLTYAVRSGQLLAADGTLIPIIGGEPSPWPTRGSFVGLTLFAFDWPPTGGSITFTPYRYNPNTGTATAGTPFSKAYTDPGEGYTLRYVSYWTSTP